MGCPWSPSRPHRRVGLSSLPASPLPQSWAAPIWMEPLTVPCPWGTRLGDGHGQEQEQPRLTAAGPGEGKPCAGTWGCCSLHRSLFPVSREPGRFPGERDMQVGFCRLSRSWPSSRGRKSTAERAVCADAAVQAPWGPWRSSSRRAEPDHLTGAEKRSGGRELASGSGVDLDPLGCREGAWIPSSPLRGADREMNFFRRETPPCTPPQEELLPD